MMSATLSAASAISSPHRRARRRRARHDRRIPGVGLAQRHDRRGDGAARHGRGGKLRRFLAERFGVALEAPDCCAASAATFSVACIAAVTARSVMAADEAAIAIRLALAPTAMMTACVTSAAEVARR